MNNNKDSVAPTTTGDNVSVIFVVKKNAKTVKIAMENHGWIHKDFRMTPAHENSFPTDNRDVSYVYKDCLAIPVLPEYMENAQEEDGGSWAQFVIGRGIQRCPFSTSVLGNRHKRQALQPSNPQQPKGSTIHWPPSKQALFLALQARFPNVDDDKTRAEWQEQISSSLDSTICPSKLEYLGDDQNLVLPSSALLLSDLESFLKNKLNLLHDDDSNKSFCMQGFLDDFLWPQLAQTYSSPRILRKGGVDPNSRIRQTGYQLLWYSQKLLTTIPDNDHPKKINRSPGWITVTEQGIRQSLDVTQVMFSRGNISEKIRFGKGLVQKNDVVLDLYAGIGYYTLPALVHGQALHVYACEWNPHALQCLEYNLRDNQVTDRSTVVTGDCRNLVLPKRSSTSAGVVPPGINRVSLGLLPSSEGGWKTAVKAILGTLPIADGDATSVGFNTQGGWLHVHGNVPVKEREAWAQWLVRSFHSLVLQELLTINNGQQEGSSRGEEECSDWVVICHHVERVKSFAPTVNHYVADVFVGPRERAQVVPHPQHEDRQTDGGALMHQIGNDDNGCYVYDKDNNSFAACPAKTVTPSCALSPDGALHQEWMRATDS